MRIERPGRRLRLLTAVLRGRLPREADWPEIIEAANRGWLSPALYVALERAGCLDAVPTDVKDYLTFLHGRNRERNERLRSQLIEAVSALNARAIQPILLKGAIHLFAVPDERLGSRMMSDVDLSVDPREAVVARTALEALGYQEATGTRGMGRAHDVGLIELRDRPSSRSAAYLSGDLRASSALVERDGAVACVPSPTARALHLIVHDMIKEGDYWRLRIDLRHLNDLAELASSADGIDWARIRATLSDPVGRRALEVQAMALQDLFGIAIPAELHGGAIARLKHSARLTSETGGTAATLARTAGRLAWGVYRLANGYSWQGGWDFVQRARRSLVAPGKGPRF